MVSGRFIGLRWLWLPILLCAGCGPVTDASRPPGQPPSGPGGADYAHAAVVRNTYGQGAEEYHLFEPAAPVPESAPVVVFCHGWPLMTPQLHIRWIEHIVRKGNIVVFPRYQDDVLTPPDRFLPNAARAVARAVERLGSGGHVRAEVDHIAFIGFSCGASVAMNMAAVAGRYGLPAPAAVLCATPDAGSGPLASPGSALVGLGGVRPETLVLIVVSEPDHLVGDAGGWTIYNRLPQVPVENKSILAMYSDTHGWPPLIADHVAPVASEPWFESRTLYDLLLIGAVDAMGWGTPNALDFYGYWKLFDGLCDAAFHGRNREYALGNTLQQVYMGTWSDGVPVRPLLVLE